MIDNAPVNIIFKLDSDEIFGVALFEVPHVADPVVEGEVIDEGVEVEMEILSIARDVEIAHFDGRVAAEDQDWLRFVGVLPQVLHDLVSRHWHLLHVLLPEVVLTLDEIDHCLHVRLPGTIVRNPQGHAVLSEALGYSLQLESNRLWVLPDEIALRPCLEDYQHEENQQRTQINKEVFC